MSEEIKIENESVFFEDEPVKKKPRARKTPTVKKVNPAALLVEALKFVSFVQKKAGTLLQQHCIIFNNWLIAGNEVLTMGARIQEDLTACPNTMLLIEALDQCDETLSIVASSEALNIQSGNFKVSIECMPFPELIPFSPPDQKIINIDNKIKLAISMTCSLVNENGTAAHLAGILLQSGSAVGTDGSRLVEYWHGFHLPTIILPRAACNAILKCKKDLTGFGFSQETATFYFDDESFIKSRIYVDNYVNYLPFFEVPINPWPLPDNFVKALKTIEPFCTRSHVFLNKEKGLISSHETDNDGCGIEFEGVPATMAFNIKFLLSSLFYASSADFQPENNRVYFYGENFRGVCMAVGEKK